MTKLITDGFSIPEYISLRQQVNYVRRVSIVDTTITANERVDRSGVSARAYINGIWGMASMGMAQENVATVISGAIKNAKDISKWIGIPKKHIVLPVNNYCVYDNEEEYVDVDQTELLHLAQKISREITKRCKSISSQKVMVYSDAIEKYISIDGNLPKHDLIKRSYVCIEISKADSLGNVISVVKKKAYPDMFKANDLSEDAYLIFVDVAYKELLDKSNGMQVERGTYPCILHPDVTGTLVHEAIGHNVEADIAQNGSYVNAYLGKSIASERICVTDFANHAFGHSVGIPIYIDDEGMGCYDVPIISKGILSGYLHSRQTAYEFGATPTGNARAYLASDEPIVRMRNTALHPGTDNVEDMIQSIDDGYYLISPCGGQADTDGEFMLSIDMGYHIKNGRIDRAIYDTTISGNAVDVLKSISMLSKDLIWDYTGLCGKMQSMIVGIGGPYIKCNLYLGRD